MKTKPVLTGRKPRSSFYQMAQKKPVPVFVGGSGFLVKAPSGMSRAEVEHELKVVRLAREIYSGKLMELIRP